MTCPFTQTSERYVFLALPHYGAITPSALPGIMNPMLRDGRIFLNTNGASLLAHNFNRLYCAALNMRPMRRFSHFAMMHSDIEAPEGWLDTLLDEMDAHQADVMSCVVPLKDSRGLTSTGIQMEDNQIRRLTMTEIMDLPETFDAAAAGFPGSALMVNTGLWAMRFTEPWIEEFTGFEVRDVIVRVKPGDTLVDLGGPQFQCRVLSEDWNASGWWHRRGLRVMATRKVPVTHHGAAKFSNTHVWGTMTSDQGDKW